MATENADAVLARLRDAHVEHVMRQLSGDELRDQLALEVEALYERLQSVTLSEIAPAERVQAYLVTLVQTAPITPELKETVVAIGQALRSADTNKDVKLGHFITRGHYDRVVQQLAQLDELRGQLIRSVMASPLYSGLISDVLYYGIKDYLLSENNVAMKVPGMGSLMKLGKGVLDKAAPNLEHAAEKAIKGYIQGNIKRTLSISEKFLDNALNASNIVKVSDHFWTMANETTLRDVVKRLPEDQWEKSASLIEEIWRDVRLSPHVSAWIGEGVQAFYQENGQKALAPWLAALGYDRQWVTLHLQQWVPELVERDVVRAYLRERVKAQLSAFYESDAAQAAVQG